MYESLSFIVKTYLLSNCCWTQFVIVIWQRGECKLQINLKFSLFTQNWSTLMCCVQFPSSKVLLARPVVVPEISFVSNNIYLFWTFIYLFEHSGFGIHKKTHCARLFSLNENYLFTSISPRHLLEISKRWGDIKIGYKAMSAWEPGTLQMNVGFEMFYFIHSLKYENFGQWSFSSWWIKRVAIGRCIWTVELRFTQSWMTLLLLTVSKLV